MLKLRVSRETLVANKNYDKAWKMLEVAECASVTWFHCLPRCWLNTRVKTIKVAGSKWINEISPVTVAVLSVSADSPL